MTTLLAAIGIMCFLGWIERARKDIRETRRMVQEISNALALILEERNLDAQWEGKGQ